MSDPVENLVSHIKDCLEADAAIVVDGSADPLIEKLLSSGWTWDGNVQYVEGKRIRTLTPPKGSSNSE